jgi:Ser-tRNA(Ala) deacylase AlaX
LESMVPKYQPKRVGIKYLKKVRTVQAKLIQEKMCMETHVQVTGEIFIQK